MRKIICFFSSVILLANLSGCGDNKTKEKLYGTQVITSNSYNNPKSPATYSSTLATDSATMVTKMGQGVGVTHAPSALRPTSILYGANPPGMGNQDTNGFYSSTQGASVISVRFLDGPGTGNTITFDQVTTGAMRGLEVKIATQYQYGAWNGDFFLSKASPYGKTDPETITSGSITSSDPIGGSFSATIAAGMTMDMITLADGTQVGVPKSGSMTLSSVSGGYTGTMTYAVNTAADHTCDGNILVGTMTVASVHLKFDKTNVNYAGYYTDADGVSHNISPQ